MPRVLVPHSADQICTAWKPPVTASLGANSVPQACPAMRAQTHNEVGSLPDVLPGDSDADVHRRQQRGVVAVVVMSRRTQR